VADPAEVQQNPRARSARLRIGERVKEVSAMQ
jgi:16S rRNA C1402 N4-methylase RsmH